MDRLEHLERVEDTFYKRSLHNALIGGAKGALIGIAIGCAIGALLAMAAIAFPAVAPVIPFAISHGALGIAAAAVKTGLVFGGITAGFGSVAAINSTRDARRFAQADRLPALTASQERERRLMLQKSGSLPEQDAQATQAEITRFQDLLRKQTMESTAGIGQQSP